MKLRRWDGTVVPSVPAFPCAIRRTPVGHRTPQANPIRMHVTGASTVERRTNGNADATNPIDERCEGRRRIPRSDVVDSTNRGIGRKKGMIGGNVNPCMRCPDGIEEKDGTVTYLTSERGKANRIYSVSVKNQGILGFEDGKVLSAKRRRTSETNNRPIMDQVEDSLFEKKSTERSMNKRIAFHPSRTTRDHGQRLNDRFVAS